MAQVAVSDGMVEVTEVGSSSMIDNEVLSQLDSGQLACLIRAIPIQKLRQLLRSPKLGKDLTRQYFAGFRVDKVNQATAVRFFELAVRGMKGGELSQALLQAWVESQPAVLEISRVVLGRSSPFSGHVTSDFFDRLEAVIDESLFSVLKKVAQLAHGDETDGHAAAAPSWDAPPDASDESPEQQIVVEREDLEGRSTPIGMSELLSDARWPIADQLFRSIPKSFDTVVARDYWLLNNETLLIPLLGTAGEDRLAGLPTDVQARDTNGLALASYAEHVASEVEAESSWTAAQAYWLAAARIRARAGKSEGGKFLEAVHDFVRSGLLSSDLPVRESDAYLPDLVGSGLRSSSTPIREAAVKSLIMAVAIDDSIYDEAVNGRSMELLANSVEEMFPRLRQRLKNIRNARDRFTMVARDYTALVSNLQTMTDEIASGVSIERVRSVRPNVLASINSLEQFILPYDRHSLTLLRRLLIESITAYDGADDDFLDDAYGLVLSNYLRPA